MGAPSGEVLTNTFPSIVQTLNSTPSCFFSRPFTHDKRQKHIAGLQMKISTHHPPSCVDAYHSPVSCQAIPLVFTVSGKPRMAENKMAGVHDKFSGNCLGS